MDAPLTIGLFAVAGIVLLGTAVRSRRHWGEPGAESFTAVTVALGGTALAMAARAVDPLAELVAIPLLYCFVPVAWAIFAFEFTGRYDVASARRRLLLAAPAAYEVVGYVGFTLAASVITGRSASAIDVDSWYVVVNSATGATQAVLTAFYTVLFLGVFYLLALLVVATAVLVGQLVRYDHLGPGVATCLAASVVGPWIVMVTGDSLAASANFDVGSIQLSVAATFAVSAVGMATALERYELFAAAPAAGTVGPERVLEDLSEPIVVVDHDERAIRLNPAAERLFGTGQSHVGTPLVELLGHDVDSLGTAGSFDIDGVDGYHHFEATVSEMVGRDGRVRGHTIVLRDVTGREVRQQRLEVLNRVLRHNLRNDLTAIRGRAELLGSGETDETLVKDVIIEKADSLVALSDRAREVEHMLSIPVVEGQSCSLGDVVASVVADVEAENDAEVTVAVPEEVAVGVDARILHPVVHNLIVNAIRHHDRERPTIELSATVGGGSLPVTLRVVDDGPGLPEQERLAVERGQESPLEHGSGLGLWAIKWGVARIGGNLSISESEPRGTVVEVRLPAPGSAVGPSRGADTDVAAEGQVADSSVAGSQNSEPSPRPGPVDERPGTGQ